ncbi:MAG TPA: hypothetical protein VK464_25730 [Symbiobacteriaceae bacterium]|jgi:hypothetical protein|nr:hypothetical protein [Symbiobacteriaceae bacterium]
MEKKEVSKLNEALENALELEDFVIEEIPALPLALRQSENSWTPY